MTKSPINFRAFLITALFIIAAIFFGYVYIYNKIFGIVLVCAEVTVAAVCAIAYLRKFMRGKAKLRVFIASVLSAALCVCAFTVFVCTYENWRKYENLDGYYNVSGRICAFDTRTGQYRVNLEDVYIDGESVDGMMRVTFRAADDNIAETLIVGDRLSFGANINAVDFCGNGKVNGTAYRTDVRYTATVDGSDVYVDHGFPNAFEGFIFGLRDLYVDNMGDDYGNIAFSMLTGDKYGLDDSISDYFTAAGLGHIMAVSGLHIGFAVLLLNLILCKLHKKVRIPIIGVVLIGYCILADFSPSVVRATIMAAVAGLSFLIGGRRDLMSSLMFAFTCILAVKPAYLFDVGFLLSFCSIFGIALFANSISRFLNKHGVDNKISSAIGGSAAVSIGILPAEIYFFGCIRIFSIIVNIVALPYIAFVFMATVVLTPIAAIPGLGAVLTVSKYLLMPINYISYAISLIPFATIRVAKVSAAIFLSYPIMFCMSEYYMMKRDKIAVIIYSLVTIAALVALSLL